MDGGNEAGLRRKGPKRVLTQGQQKRFDEFYRGYPRKEDPGTAERAWAKLDDGTEDFLNRVLPALIQGRDQYAGLIQREHRPRDKIKLPATWLNARGWESDYREVVVKTPYDDL